MRNFNDPHYQKSQYANAGNLEARIRVHKQFSTNPYGVFNWIFDQALPQIPAQASVLEVGSGSGEMWVWVRTRVPAGWDVTLSDFSMGILNDAKKKLADVPFEPEYREIDAQSIPYPDNSFDAVFANFMLYHVPDRIKAIAEIRRVLKPDGVLFAATFGDNYMREYNQLVYKILFNNEFQKSLIHENFSIENGADQLQKSFGHVEIHTYADDLKVTEADPIVDYLLSQTFPNMTSEHVEKFTEAVRDIITKEGEFFIQKHTGLFIGRGYAGK